MSAASAAPVATPSATAPAAAAPASAPAETPAAPAAAPTPSASGFAVNLPKGLEDRYGGLVEMMKSKGFSSEHGQALVDFSAAQMAASEKAHAASEKAAGERAVAEYRNHEKYGGPNLQQTEALVARAEAQIKLPDEFKSFYEAEVFPGVKFKDTLAGKSLMRSLGELIAPDNIAGSLKGPAAKSESAFSPEFQAQIAALGQR